MEIAVSPQPVRTPANSRPEPAPASESGEGFATAVDATLAGKDSASAQQGPPPSNGFGTPNVSSPLFAPDILVTGPNEHATLPAETPEDAFGLVPPSPQDPTGLVPPSPQAKGRESFRSTPSDEAKPALPEDGAGRDVQSQPEAPVPSKNGAKPASKASESTAESPLPQATCLVVHARTIDRSGPGRSAQPTQRTPAPRAAEAAEKDDDPAGADEAEATIAPPQILPLSVPKVHGAAQDIDGGVPRDPGTGKGAVIASDSHSARETEPHAVARTQARVDGDAAGFALPPSATDKGEAGLTAPGFAGAESTRSQLHIAEPKVQAAAQPVVAAQPGRFGHDLGVEIARRISAGGDQLVVRLSPAELGRIEVRMSFDDRGGLSTVFAADSRAALDMLRRDSADLSRALNDAGFRSETSMMRFDSGDRGSGGQPRTPWQNAAPKSGSGADTFETELLDQTAFRTLQTRGRYDLMA